MNKQNWIAITVSDQVQIISVIIALWFVWVFLFFSFFFTFSFIKFHWVWVPSCYKRLKSGTIPVDTEHSVFLYWSTPLVRLQALIQQQVKHPFMLHLHCLPILFTQSVTLNHCVVFFSVCSPNITANITGYQCTCEESFAWSYNKCIDYEACDAIVGDTCGCINGLPADGQYCQLKTSNPGRTRQTCITCDR